MAYGLKGLATIFAGQEGTKEIYTMLVWRMLPVSNPPKRPLDRLKELTEKLGQWIDGVVQPRQPELIPIPVRRPDRRRPR